MAIDFPSFGYAKSDEVSRFIESFDISYPILLGDAEVVPRFCAGPLTGVPMTIIYAPDGRRVGQQVGQMTGAQIEKIIETAQLESSAE